MNRGMRITKAGKRCMRRDSGGVKRVTAVFAAVCLSAAVLTGCGGAGGDHGAQTAAQAAESDGKKTVAMGRYVEQSVKLPQLPELESVLGVMQNGRGTALYTFHGETESEGSYYVYRLQEDGSWKQETAQWLESVFLGKKQFVRNIRAGEGDSLYVWYCDEEYRSHLLRTTDERQAEEIKLEGFDEKERMPNGFAPAGNGKIAVSYMGGGAQGSIVLYDEESGKKLRSFASRDPATDNICGMMDARGSRLAVVSEAGDGFTVYDTKTGAVVDELKVEKDQETGVIDGVIRIGDKDDYYYLSAKGLGHFQSGGSIMEMMIDGSLNMMGLEGIWHKELFFSGAQDYTVWSEDGEACALTRYTYDADMPAVPEIQLTMYGLAKNKSVARAVGAYQQKNPDVQITYYTAQSEEGASTISDSIRTLNTELLSGKGPDILLLDGLPVEAYIEKGILTDLSSVMDSEDGGRLYLKNLTKGYEDGEGAVYGIPVRFSMPILVGDEKVCEAMQSLDSLRSYVKAHEGEAFLSYNYRTVTYEDLAELIFLINYRELLGESGRPDKEVLIDFLKTVRETGKAIGATKRQTPKPPATEEDLKSIAQFAEQQKKGEIQFEYGIFPVEDGTVYACEIKGVWDMMEPVGIKKQYGRKITSVNSLYIPKGVIGVSRISGQKEKAMDFVRFILSEEEQGRDLGDGMPVNTKALESYCDKESDISAGSGYTHNGKEVRLNFSWPSREERTGMVDLAKTLTEPLNIDRVFQEMILSESKPYFEGSISADQAADAILSKAGTYLAE